jgi:hypothetical protein
MTSMDVMGLTGVAGCRTAASNVISAENDKGEPSDTVMRPPPVL